MRPNLKTLVIAVTLLSPVAAVAESAQGALAVALSANFDTIETGRRNSDIETVVESLSVAAAFGAVVGASAVANEDGDTAASAVAGSNWDSTVNVELDAERGGYSSYLEIEPEYYY